MATAGRCGVVPVGMFALASVTRHRHVAVAVPNACNRQAAVSRAPAYALAKKGNAA